MSLDTEVAQSEGVMTTGEHTSREGPQRPAAWSMLEALDPAAAVIHYRSWRVVNPEPFDAAASVAQLCFGVSNEQFRDHPHMYRRGANIQSQGAPIRVWVNPLAEQAMLYQIRPRFPVGSIIVKEKLIGAREWEHTGVEGEKTTFTRLEATPELLTVMIKRELGYNPEVGDWEFLAYSGNAQQIQVRGRLAHCQQCHVSQAETDFVFRSYLPDSLPLQVPALLRPVRQLD